MALSTGNLILIALAVAGVIAVGVWLARIHAERERQRLAGLAHWAGRNGFIFDPQDPWNLDARYNGIGDIGKGHNRCALETLTRQDPVPCALFRYHYRTWETRTVTRNGHTTTERYEADHWKRYLIVELGAAFPGFSIRLESLMDRMAGFIGFDDIDFESEAFSKRYFVKSDDRQFAYALIHPRMMEWLLPLSFSASLFRGALVMDLGAARHSAEASQTPWAEAVGFINRIPPFVWQDYGRRPPVALPEPTPFVPPPVAPPVR